MSNLFSSITESLQRNLATIFVTIVFFVTACLNILGDFLAAGFQKIFSNAYMAELYAYMGMLCLVVITSIGLFKGQLWAKPFGAVLGVLLILPSFLKPYTQDDPTWITNPLSTLQDKAFMIYCGANLLASGYLLFSAQLKTKPLSWLWVFTYLLLIGLSLLSYSTLTLHRIVYSYRHALDIAEAKTIRGALKAGSSYKIPGFGIELTFPDDRTIYQQDGSEIEFAKTGVDRSYDFTVTREDIYDNQTTLDGIIQHETTSEPHNQVFKTKLNNVDCVKSEYWPNDEDISFQYILIVNNQLIHISHPGGSNPETFNRIAQTLTLD